MSVCKKGPIVEGGLCRGCGSVKRCRLLDVEYEWSGLKEIYAEMFLDCFGLCLSNLDGDAAERLICATCVTRLRDASSFRLQVLRCEERLLQAHITVDDEAAKLKMETEIKEEMEDSCDGCDGDRSDVQHGANEDSIKCEVKEDSNSMDDLPLVLAAERMRSEPTGDGLARRGLRDTHMTLEVEVDEWKPEVKEKSPKRRSKRKAAVEENATGKKKMLVKIKKMRDKLKKIHDTSKVQVMRPWKSASQKAFHNTIVLVENSYVCPFVTTFSDYHCVYCKELHTDPEKLREHTMAHDPKTYQDTVNYKRSLQIDITRIDCRLCPKPIDNLEEFYTHITTAHDMTLYPNIKNEFLKFRLKLGNLDCIECGMVFPYFHALKKHMALHFGTWICDVCGAHFFEEAKLMLHQKTHQTQKTDDAFPCNDCGKVFKSKHGRYYHVSRQHSDTPGYPCYKCDEVLFSHTLRYRHMIEAHGEQRTFPCENCDKVYDTRKSLREHNRKNHLKLLKHECGVCDKKFYLPSALKDHMASHTGERNFRCEYCGKSYPRMRALRVHVQSHGAEKKYKCGVCNASYTQGNNLKHHLRAKHPHVEQME